MFEKQKKFKVVIRICVGCVLPSKAKLIGSGEYQLLMNGVKRKELYYDYEIDNEDLEFFLEQNVNLLRRYQLIDDEVVEDEDSSNR